MLSLPPRKSVGMSRRGTDVKNSWEVVVSLSRVNKHFTLFFGKKQPERTAKDFFLLFFCKAIARKKRFNNALEPSGFFFSPVLFSHAIFFFSFVKKHNSHHMCASVSLRRSCKKNASRCAENREKIYFVVVYENLHLLVFEA